MKIVVKSREHNIHFRIPTLLLFSRGSAWLAEKLGRRYAKDAMEELPPGSVPVLCAELRRIKKKYGTYPMVELESADGDLVKIQL